MFGESLKVLMCLSVLMSTCVSLHMVRDAYHRPINDHSPNPYGIIDRNGDDGRSIVNNWIDHVDDQQKWPSNDENGSKNSFKALNLDFERLIEPTKNDHHNYNGRPRIGSGGGGAGAGVILPLPMPMIFATNQKRKYQMPTNRLTESKLSGDSSSNTGDDDVTNENHGSRYELLSHSSKPLIPKNTVSFRSGLLPYSSNDRFQWQKQAWISEPVKKQQQQHPSKQSPSTSSINKINHSSISIDTMDKQIKTPDTQMLQPQDKQQQNQQKANDKLNQQHLTKRTSNTARINGDDIDVDGYHDFGSQEWKLDYSDQDHMDVMDGVRQPVAPKGVPNNFISRGMRGQRQYDVPQIECPPAPDGMERFACPTPDRQGRYRCIDDHVLCDGFIDCPDGEDEERQSCMFYKTTKAHLDVLADALLRWARGR